ncbi:MAG: YabP/YqfC family sporulation protein [Christensenellales bacterium]
MSSLGTITVRGKDLKIAKFNTSDGTISFSGTVDSVVYDKKKNRFSSAFSNERRFSLSASRAVRRRVPAVYRPVRFCR